MDTAASDRALLARQSERHQRATRLLEGLQVLDRWWHHGTPHLCGAYAHRLLVAPDIDIEIHGRPDIQAGFAVAAGIASCTGVRKVTFINALEDEDAGLGWEAVCADHADAWWKVQMWLLPPDYTGPRSVDLLVPLRQRLEAPTRCSILRIKERLLETATPYRSIDIYRAVLDHGVTSPEEYARWVRQHASTGLISWLPARE
jgi:hypothetical protein